MSQNISRGGMYDALGNFNDRWPLLAERINEFQPDVLLLCELNGWDNIGHKALVRATNDLDMDAVPFSAPASGYGTGLLFRRETMGRWQFHNTSMSHATTHGFAVTGFDVGLPSLLNFAPVHLCYYSAQKAAEEAQLIISKTLSKSPYSIIGGDINYPPASGPNPDYKQARPYNWTARTLIESGEHLEAEDMIADRRVAWTFKRANFVDSGQEMYKRTGDKTCIAPTVDDDDRIDQIWVSGALGPALTSYSMTTKNESATDHAGIVVQLDTEKIDTSQTWSRQLY